MLGLKVMTSSVMSIYVSINASKHQDAHAPLNCVCASMGGGQFLRFKFGIHVVLKEAISIILSDGCLLVWVPFFQSGIFCYSFDNIGDFSPLASQSSIC